MQQSEIIKSTGFQRLTCKNPGCNFLLKEICFFEGWTQKTNVSDGVTFTRNNGSSYYLCPKCNAKNIVTKQGEKIIIEKIISFELA
jgi:Zn finger protein HypA/HybF involved in hydrogenase expression